MSIRSRLINKKARDVEGVRESTVTVVQTEPLLVRLELQILPDYNVPGRNYSSKVKEYLAETMGIEVAVWRFSCVVSERRRGRGYRELG